MLQKRKRSMQTGLKDLADVVDYVFGEMSAVNPWCKTHMKWSHGAEGMQNGAKKLRSLTRKTVVDYGTHIKYEAMKGLVVGGVDVHRELNDFISAWKLRSPREAGSPMGELMRKFATIQGHDEL